jgi:hypothetical protein
MKHSFLIGIIGGAVVGFLQYFSFIHSMHADMGNFLEQLFFFSPQIIFFMCIYMSIKIYVRNQPDPVPDYKRCLKAGGITMLIIVLFWWIAFFVSLTHTDVNALIKYTAQNDKEDIPVVLANYTAQGIFDHSKFLILPQFLLGFVMTVLVTVITRLRKKPA